MCGRVTYEYIFLLFVGDLSCKSKVTRVSSGMYSVNVLGNATPRPLHSRVLCEVIGLVAVTAISGDSDPTFNLNVIRLPALSS
jgi:hypothetical protein